MLVPEVAAELWADQTVRCVLVPHGQQVDVELRNINGSAFLRKTAPSRQAALNQAEYLRLLLRTAERNGPSGSLKPFALVVAKDRDHGDALGEALRISGMRALECHSGVAAVELARELAPDLVVVDHRLPDVDVAEVCRRLREDRTTAATPIIAVTASPEALRAEGCAADAVLTKPCPPDTLIAAARLFVRHLASAPDARL
jgi:CheY-like chemotaxis protein